MPGQTINRVPPTTYPGFVWPTVDPSTPLPQLVTQLNVRMKALEAMIASLYRMSLATAPTGLPPTDGEKPTYVAASGTVQWK